MSETLHIVKETAAATYFNVAEQALEISRLCKLQKDASKARRRSASQAQEILRLNDQLDCVRDEVSAERRTDLAAEKEAVAAERKGLAERAQALKQAEGELQKERSTLAAEFAGMAKRLSTAIPARDSPGSMVPTYVAVPLSVPIMMIFPSACVRRKRWRAKAISEVWRQGLQAPRLVGSSPE